MPRYRGTVTQSILDWYAAQAMAAQQWFSQGAPNYWVFSLLNNALDGRRIWVYDAETVSGAAFPAGTGNPGGNPNAVAGYQGGGGTSATWALINKNNTIANNVQSLAVTALSGIVAGNLIVVQMLAGALAASFIQPPDATWIRLASADGNSNSPALAAFAHIATGSEPASWTFTHTAGVNLQLGASASQWSGNSNPVAIDGGAGNVSFSAAGAMIAPALNLTALGDIVFTAYGVQDHAQSPFTGDPSFTLLDTFITYARPMWIGYKIVANRGAVGPFIGTQAPAEPYGAVSFALKASNAGGAPGQIVSAPISSVSPVAPGLFTLGFSQSPIAFGGITRWIPPASHFAWHREAPIAVLQAGDQFNLAGISPENAAWGSVTWLAIK
jgi:hypothetical protein